MKGTSTKRNVQPARKSETATKRKTPLERLDVTDVGLFNTPLSKVLTARQCTQFKQADIKTVYSLLTRLKPKRYLGERILPLVKASFQGRVIDFPEPMRKGFYVDVETLNTGDVYRCVAFFPSPWLFKRLVPGAVCRVTGTLKPDAIYGDNFIVKSLDVGVKSALTDFQQVEYGTFKGITPDRVAKAIKTCLSRCTFKGDIGKTLRDLHAPTSEAVYDQALKKLKVFEFAVLESFYSQDLTFVQCEAAQDLEFQSTLCKLGFTPTKGQVEAINSLSGLLECDSSGRGLLVGDVGCGKTLVAANLTLKTVRSGYQVVYLAPTVSLAEQVYEEFHKFLPRVRISRFYGEMAKTEVDTVKHNLATGKSEVVICTTKVLFDVQFANLGLIIVDEQQKFGVKQREQLVTSRCDGKLVNLICQSATPIPHTLANISMGGNGLLVQIEDKPAGRLPVHTELFTGDLPNTRTSDLWSQVDKLASEHRGVFVICPYVTSTRTSNNNVILTTKKLARIFPNLKVDCIHGSLTKTEQLNVIKRFREHQIDILVGSSLVEVGVDIKHAGGILILDSDRFGLSSLHQMRGRVGRNSDQAYCWLHTDKPETERLQEMCNSNDGFYLALKDMEYRGVGDLLSTEQAGVMKSLTFIDVLKDGNLQKLGVKLFLNRKEQIDRLAGKILQEVKLEQES